MYKHELKVSGGYLAKAQVVPQNTSADGNGGAQEISGTQGGIEVIAKVGATALGLADTKIFTIKLQQSADNGVGDAYADLHTIYTVTAAGAVVVAAGSALGRFIIPTTAERYIRAVIVSDDAAMTGTVDIYPVYLPR